MVGFFVAYVVIAAVVSKNIASWTVHQRLVESWLQAFKPAFFASLLLLWLGHFLVW
jgi:hypothetical protein